MLIAYLQKVLTAPLQTKSKSYIRFWLSLSLTFAALYGIWGLKQAFSADYVVPDDARQHVFWLQRLIDPELFPHDLIANYLQSVAPRGYTTLYWLAANLGISPLLLNKLLPLALGLITTAYGFGFCLQILPVPAAGFIATLLLNQNLWMEDDFPSGTPIAFVYPLSLAFLYYLSRRSLFPFLLAIALMGLFYPQGVFICAGILVLRFWDWQHFPPPLSRHRQDYLFGVAGLAVALIVMLPYAWKTSTFGPTIAAAQAQMLPEFLPGGRTVFFFNNPLDYWFCSGRSGMLPVEWCQPKSLLLFPQIWAGLLLPLLLQFPSRFPLARLVRREVTLLPQLALVSLGMFFAAHAVLFKLYLPNRYTRHSLRILMVTAAAVALVIVLDAILQACLQQVKPRAALGVVVMLGILLLLPPSLMKLTRGDLLNADYRYGVYPGLYEFFKRQPKDILIASLAVEADNLPTFAQRSVLVSREYANPYQVGFYQQFRQRTLDLIDAQYSQDLTEVKNFIRQYKVDFWLLERAAFTPKYVANHEWMRQFQPQAALTRLQQGIRPALSQVEERCTVFAEKDLVVLQADCITAAATASVK